jgi:hypothetical protein
MILGGEIMEITVQASLDADTADDLPFGGTELIFQEKVVPEERENRMDDEISLSRMDKDGNLNN